MSPIAGEIFTKAALIEQCKTYTSRKKNPKPSYFGRELHDKDFFIRYENEGSPEPLIRSREVSGESGKQLHMPWLRSVHRDLIDGIYQHGTCRPIEVIVNGKKRVLDRIRFIDKVVQGVVAARLAMLIDDSLYCGVHGFRPSHSCHTALCHVVLILQETGYQYVVRIDIKKFYDNIPLTILIKKIEEASFPPELVRFLLSALGAATHSWNPEKGLPTGWPINPPLANLFLRDSDWQIVRLAGVFVRYADDYFIPVPSAEVGEQILRQVTAILGDLGLIPGDDKSKTNFLVGNSDSILPFLGHLVGKRPPSFKGNLVCVTPHLKAIDKIKNNMDAAFAAYLGDQNGDAEQFTKDADFYLQGVSGYYATYNAGWCKDTESNAITNLNARFQARFNELLPVSSEGLKLFKPRLLRVIRNVTKKYEKK